MHTSPLVTICRESFSSPGGPATLTRLVKSIGVIPMILLYSSRGPSTELPQACVRNLRLYPTALVDFNLKSIRVFETDQSAYILTRPPRLDKAHIRLETRCMLDISRSPGFSAPYLGTMQVNDRHNSSLLTPTFMDCLFTLIPGASCWRNTRSKQEMGNAEVLQEEHNLPVLLISGIRSPQSRQAVCQLMCARISIPT